MPDARVLDGLLEYGEAGAQIVPVARIFGMKPEADKWNRDWTLREEEFRDDPDRLRRHQTKLTHLLLGDPDRGRPSIRESDLVEGLRWKFLTLHLVEIDGLYFVGSGGVHRVAVAHQLGFERLKAFVTPARFKSEAPKAARVWVASFRRSGEEVLASSHGGADGNLYNSSSGGSSSGFGVAGCDASGGGGGGSADEAELFSGIGRAGISIGIGKARISPDRVRGPRPSRRFRKAAMAATIPEWNPRIRPLL